MGALLKSISKLGWAAYGLAAFVILADQLSKYWILYVYDLPARFSTPIAGPFSLTMVWNRGVSFGLFRADADLVRWILTLFSICVAVALAIWVRKAHRPLLGVGLGLARAEQGVARGAFRLQLLRTRLTGRRRAQGVFGRNHQRGLRHHAELVRGDLGHAQRVAGGIAAREAKAGRRDEGGRDEHTVQTHQL